MQILKRFIALPAAAQIQLVLETLGLFILVAITLRSLSATSWVEAATYFVLSLVLADLASERFSSVLQTHLLTELPQSVRQAEFDNLTMAPEQWIFRGGLGRWFRYRAVSAVANAARRNAPVRAVLIDPRDEGSCAAYARYRQRSGYYTDHTTCARGIQAEVLATVAVMFKKDRETRITPALGFTRNYSPSRIDCNGEEMIVTTPDRGLPTLKLRKGHWLYDVFTDEVTEILEHGPVVQFPKGPMTTDFASPQAVREALERLEVNEGGHSTPLLSGFASDEVDWKLVHEAIGAEWKPNLGS